MTTPSGRISNEPEERKKERKRKAARIFMHVGLSESVICADIIYKLNSTQLRAICFGNRRLKLS